MTAAPALLEELRSAPLQILGRFAEASNLTLLAETADGLRCVYKPVAGERPLWDFPTGTLAGREVAMYELARALGWDLVPETGLRADGPHGPGVCQRFVDRGTDDPVRLLSAAAVPAGWLVVARGEREDGGDVALVHRDDPQLRRLALLDAIANNADRKGGHILADASGRVWGIDHGLAFHEQDKLRTVLWGFAGQQIHEADLGALRRLAHSWETFEAVVAPQLTPAEIAAAFARLASLLASGRYFEPGPGWPRLPWPPL